MAGFIGLVCGFLFGIGLIISAMVNPDKVLAFLDVFGDWDPSLMFVMGGAVCVTLVGFPLVLKRAKPLFSDSFSMPLKQMVDRRLILGSMLFGAGWGLSGYCPGPGFTQFGASLVQGQWIDPLIFLLTFFIGSGVARLLFRA